MAHRKYRLSRRAIADLEEIAEYLGNHSPKASGRVIQALYRTFDSLSKSPEIGTSMHNMRPGLRMLVPSKPAANYIIFFYAERPGILISDVIHAARNWEGLFSSGKR